MTSTGTAGYRRRTSSRRFRRVVVLRHLIIDSPSNRHERSEEPVTQPHGTPDHRVEYRLHVRLRLRNDSDVAGRGLLLQGLRNLSVSRGQGVVCVLKFREQTDVFDRDHRLVCEALEQGNLRSVKGRTSARRTARPPSGFALAQQRDLRTAADGVELQQLERVGVLTSPRPAECRRQ